MIDKSSIDRRVVHDTTPSQKTKLKVVSREELNSPRSVSDEPSVDENMDEGTTILSDEPCFCDSDKTPTNNGLNFAVSPDETPDTTVLGMDSISDGFFEDEVHEEPKNESSDPDLITAIKQDLTERYSNNDNDKETAIDSKKEPAKESKQDIKEEAKEEIIEEIQKEEKENIENLIAQPQTEEKQLIKKKKRKKANPKRFILTRICDGDEAIINKERFIVGKSKHSDYQVLHTRTVSRSHAILTIEDGKIYIEDNKSTNGTSVDGIYLQAYEKTELKNGAIVRLSDEEFKITITGK